MSCHTQQKCIMLSNRSTLSVAQGVLIPQFHGHLELGEILSFGERNHPRNRKKKQLYNIYHIYKQVLEAVMRTNNNKKGKGPLSHAKVLLLECWVMIYEKRFLVIVCEVDFNFFLIKIKILRVYCVY